MPRAHLIILALGIVLILAAGLGERSGSEPAPTSVAGADATLGQPDLRMEGAEITQFDPAGALDYRIVADSITHFPSAGHTLLDQPHVTLYRRADAPWEISALRGRVIGTADLLRMPAAGTDAASADAASADAASADAASADAAPAADTVILDDEVRVRRQRAGSGFVELRTDHLELFPARRYARTDRPVIIDTDSGRTTAVGLRADLASGHLQLDSSPEERVRTTLFPDRLP